MTLLVRPEEFEAYSALPNGGGSSTGTAPRASAHAPKGPFATLTVSRNGIEFRYQITDEDAEWTARMVQGETGGRNDNGSHAVIWTMLNRFALLTNRKRLKTGWQRFSDFIRAYSTPLKPVLSYGSAVNYWRSPEYFKTGGYYAQDPKVPKGLLKVHRELQRTEWSKLKPGARMAAEAVLKGEAPNPVGLATEFANTATYFRRKYKRKPTIEQWREYNRTFGAAKSDPRGWIWIGDRDDLDQYGKNTFFLRTRSAPGDPTKTPIADLPADTVQLIPSGLSRELPSWDEEFESTVGGPSAGVPQPRFALAGEAFRFALKNGLRDADELTDIYFHALHPELNRRPLSKRDTALRAEWRDIRRGIVVPALAFADVKLPFAPIDAGPLAASLERWASQSTTAPAGTSTSAVQSTTASPSSGCRRTDREAVSGKCRAEECRIPVALARSLVPVPPELSINRGVKIDADALTALRQMYVAAQADLRSPTLLKLTSAYRDYDTGARSWNTKLLERFQKLGASRSVPILHEAITATSTALKDVPIPHAHDAWEEQFRKELAKRRWTSDCDPERLKWLANYLKKKTLDPVSLAVAYKWKWNTPPGNSPHLTGRALDLYLGAPARATPEGLRKLKATKAYHWLVCNAERFGFHPYAGEPWHWEYTG